jgi:hypothetical protein
MSSIFELFDPPKKYSDSQKFHPNPSRTVSSSDPGLTVQGFQAGRNCFRLLAMALSFLYIKYIALFLPLSMLSEGRARNGPPGCRQINPGGFLASLESDPRNLFQQIRVPEHGIGRMSWARNGRTHVLKEAV